MPETIKCFCPKCKAKYRLPVEAGGRVARCKRCGDRFEVPREQTLEDSIITWLTSTEEETEEVTPAKPKVISMPTEPTDGATADTARKVRGPIRMKAPGTNERPA